MSYQEAVNRLLEEDGVESSTMMKTACLRYRGEFLGMFFDKEASLIIKVSPERVNQLLAQGYGREFKFTKKRFKEWVLISVDFEDQFEQFFREALSYASERK